jgi:hypothetical protein
MLFCAVAVNAQITELVDSLQSVTFQNISGSMVILIWNNPTPVTISASSINAVTFPGDTTLLVTENNSSGTVSIPLDSIQQISFQSSILIRGDVDENASGGPDAYSASLILKYLAGLDTLSAQQIAAAEVDGNAEIEANDAYWILYATVYGTFPDGSLPKAAGVQMGSVAVGQLSSQENSDLVTVPIILEKSQGIHACYLELNIDGRYADVDSVTGNLPQGWLMVHNYANGVLKIAMAGVNTLPDGTITTIDLKLKNKGVKFAVSGSAKLNANLNSQINSFTVQAVPTQFELDQNFPNPFNPSTNINYSVPKTSLVTIKVYDILGKEVAALVNEEKSAGNYSVQFSANSNMASGVYFYRMQAGSFTETKKLILLK